MEPLTDERKKAMIEGQRGKSGTKRRNEDGEEANDGEEEDKSCMEQMQAFVMSGTFTGILIFFLLMDITSWVGGSDGGAD